MAETTLVVDDEPDVVDLVRYHLHRVGFDVLVAFTGPSGLATATESRPDAIVLDIMLPQMTGIEVCKALRKSNETVQPPGIGFARAKPASAAASRAKFLPADCG